MIAPRGRGQRPRLQFGYCRASAAADVSSGQRWIGVSEDDGKIADGANIRRQSRSDFWQRVEDNAFHLLTGADAVSGEPSVVEQAGAWE